MSYIKNVATLEYTEEKCTGCGMCAAVCPHDVFQVTGGKAKITDKDKCMECGACMINCPEGALRVNKGVGCAYAVIISKIKGRDTISCDCEGDDTQAQSCCGGGGSGSSCCC